MAITTRSPHRIVALLAALLLSALAHADFDADLLQLQNDWARIKYQTEEKQQADAFAELSARADRFAAANPQRVEARIWAGIIKSTWAGAKGGLGALKLVKAAKADLEQAIAIDANALNGSALTSLGSLYYQVPGWPVGFGDKEKAQEYLLRGLAVAPDGIDANYFYADYLFRQGRYRDARSYAERALAAPPRPGRDSADAGRRGEIEQLLRKIARELD
jgi:tetratricopeptide (TPR) repeat protein